MGSVAYEDCVGSIEFRDMNNGRQCEDYLRGFDDFIDSLCPFLRCKIPPLLMHARRCR